MNLIRFVGAALLAKIAIVANASGVLPQEVVAEFDQAVRLSDGMRLSADVYRPRAAGKHPVILRRTPYDNRLDFDGEYFAQNGYAYVVVDVRGRHDSAGEFYPYRDDARDGYEVIEWAAKQAWSNGIVGTIGDSYPGFNQWLAASETPPSLKAMVVRAAPADYYDSPTYTGGAFNLGGRLPWSVLASSRDVELRKDVLTYTSAPMERDVTEVGPVTVVLHAATSARDTDFTAKLVDVHPDGYARHLTDGILRARYRESTTQPTQLQPGQIYELRIDLAATANTFRAGHRIRLEVSSSNFPWYDRNLNTGAHPALESRFIPAQQTIHHGAAHRSRLIVSVLPFEERS